MKPSCSCPGKLATNSAAAAHRPAPKEEFASLRKFPGTALARRWPEWEIPVLIGRKAMPNGDKLFPFDDTQAIREEMGRVMPIYQGIEKLTKEGDQLQWGGPYLFKDGFIAMPHNRALFTVLDPPDRRPAEGKFYLAMRRGKPSNSMTFGTTDPLMETTRRDRILISPEDAKHLGLQDSAAVVVCSDTGKMKGVIQLAPVRSGTLQAYWPEANVLISRRTDPVSGEPNYNAEVWFEKV